MDCSCLRSEIEIKRTEDLMKMLGSKETVVQMAKANGVRWCGHVLRRDDGHVLRKVLEFEVRGKRKPGRPKKTWKMQVEKDSRSVGLVKKDTMNQARWRLGVREIAWVNPATPVYRDKPGSKLVWWWWWCDSLFWELLHWTTLKETWFVNTCMHVMHVLSPAVCVSCELFVLVVRFLRP